MRLPSWSARDWRAFIALWASILGAAVLTGFSIWVVAILRALPLTASTAPLIIGALANSNYALLGIVGAILLSLGLAINRRTLKLTREGFEASGGEADIGARSKETG
ncbi:hypothetical protein [Sphingosinicella rhizophila]|uniref:Uncharacterized protein n=1 Tax=Sphingosinicella rhizophila TaxID=3050082 RepID=A0ABU3QA61_9SPHN|nr:hypothetical protein [Sphingosinicella sp. GR2756]MDT9600300.1 hypothetical protein [Sphingosinicella sp. GR2756]